MLILLLSSKPNKMMIQHNNKKWDAWCVGIFGATQQYETTTRTLLLPMREFVIHFASKLPRAAWWWLVFILSWHMHADSTPVIQTKQNDTPPRSGMLDVWKCLVQQQQLAW
jgi:hypothetical protein